MREAAYAHGRNLEPFQFATPSRARRYEMRSRVAKNSKFPSKVLDPTRTATYLQGVNEARSCLPSKTELTNGNTHRYD